MGVEVAAHCRMPRTLACQEESACGHSVFLFNDLALVVVGQEGVQGTLGGRQVRQRMHTHQHNPSEAACCVVGRPAGTLSACAVDASCGAGAEQCV